MIYMTPEGEILQQGFNFYPLNEWQYSRGFRFRLGDYRFRVRYSVKLKKFLISFDKFSDNEQWQSLKQP